MNLRLGDDLIIPVDMFDFYKFIINCMMETFLAYAGSHANTPEEQIYLAYGNIGLFIFVVFLIVCFYIETKTSFITKHFRINNATPIVTTIACIGTLIYFAIAYIFFYK